MQKYLTEVTTSNIQHYFNFKFHYYKYYFICNRVKSTVNSTQPIGYIGSFGSW